MLLALALLGAGALVLYVGAELAVRGATWFMRAAGVPAFVLGALLFGIDLEGLGTALTASGRGETAIAGGEAFGTVLFLFTAAFGAALVVARRPIPAPSPVMLAAPAAGVAAAALVIADRTVTRLEALLLLLLYAAYVSLVLWEGLQDEAEPEVEPPPPGAPGPSGAPPPDAPPSEGPRRAPALVVTLVGLGLLTAGAFLLVAGGARVADRTALASGFVGAAILGVLTSLDEVLLEILPVRRGVPDLATGNLFGTLAAFTTGVLGLAGLIRPLTLDGGVSLAFLALAFVYAVVAGVFFARGRAGWVLGVFVLVFYAAWLVVAATA